MKDLFRCLGLSFHSAQLSNPIPLVLAKERLTYFSRGVSLQSQTRLTRARRANLWRLLPPRSAQALGARICGPACRYGRALRSAKQAGLEPSAPNEDRLAPGDRQPCAVVMKMKCVGRYTE